MKHPLALSLVVTLLACSPAPWIVEGGAVSRRVEVKARGLDLVAMTLFAPDGGGLPAQGVRNGLVLLPGGFVAADQYFWLARALARRGFVVAVPEFPLQLGFFAQDDAAVARRVLLEGDVANELEPLAAGGRVGVAGHSLGGVVAAGAAVDGGFDALVLLASYAAGGDAVEQLEAPVLSIAGERDCDAALADVRAGFARFPAESALFAIVPKLTHYGFTASLAKDVSAGCHTEVTLDAGHDDVAELVRLFLAWRLDGSTAAREQLSQRPEVVLGAAR